MQEFERRGVAATQEMQRAARRVAQENTRLRSLLARHGVSSDEVDAYLTSFDAADIVNGFRYADHHGDGFVRGGEGMVDGQRPLTQDREDDSAARQPVSMGLISPVPRAFNDDREAQDSRGTLHRAHDLQIAEKADLCPNTSDCFCPPTTAASDSTPSAGLEISCETAATIIAEMRGDRDRDAVRASLGCSAGELCNVRSATVFQIMDET